MSTTEAERAPVGPIPPIARDAYRLGVRAMAPLSPAIGVWGLVTGVAMVNGGLPVGWAIGLSLVAFAGSAQLAALPLIAVGAPLPIVWLTAALVNLRFVISSAASRAYFAELPLRQRIFCAYLNGDLGFALFAQRYGAARERGNPEQWGFFLGGAIVNWVAWQASSIVGILLGGAAPTDWGLELGASLALLAVIIPLATSFPALAGIAATAIASVAARSLPLRLGLPVAVIIGVGVALCVESLRPPTSENRSQGASADSEPTS